MHLIFLVRYKSSSPKYDRTIHITPIPITDTPAMPLRVIILTVPPGTRPKVPPTSDILVIDVMKNPNIYKNRRKLSFKNNAGRTYTIPLKPDTP